MGEHKYAALGKHAEKFDVPDKEKIEKLKALLSNIDNTPVG
jgi:hypothetical protein